MNDIMLNINKHTPLPQHDKRPVQGSSGIAPYRLNEQELQWAREGKYHLIPTAAERGIPYEKVEPRVFKTPPVNNDGRRSPEIKPTRELLELDIKRGLSNKQMATKYHLSESALSVRLKQLGLRSDRRRKPKSEAQKESGW
ncbi:hypothetical protein [Paenibacillus humicus]|uniref:hypothetical protein n=1 Tax=Paenibacillus humicus TaxID=412861 RepID=UPI000FD93316|nr:hypothetical protein [Paenibacillus humicus]